MTYDLVPMKAPRAAGWALHVLSFAVRNPLTGALLAPKLLRDAGILALRAVPTDAPLSPQPQGLALGQTPPATKTDAPTGAPVPPSLGPPAGPHETTAHFAAAYASGHSPMEVTERALAAIAATEAMSPPLRIMTAWKADVVRAAASASAERWRAGRPLGPLDGVPVAVKDELDVVGYGTTVGTAFLGTSPATVDAEVVARLRAAGAVILGKANMHEIGLGVTGVNPHHGACRNPHDSGHATGGSSSGPGAAVAAGLCPIAIGADGGGSIRIPAALCGVVGLKATFGRISEHGAAPLCWSLAHVGPLAASIEDAALAFQIMAGPDPKDPNSLGRPPVGDALAAVRAAGDLRGTRIGVYDAFFEDAESAVVQACREGVRALTDAGATVVPVRIDRLALLRAVHLVTIVSEMAAAHQAYIDERRPYGADTRLNLALARRLRSSDYVHAQRLRAELCDAARELFTHSIDALALPATGRTAPPIPPDALATGESNLVVTDAILRFSLYANVTGYPALSVPVGVDGAKLPIGLQLVGRPFEETRLLGLGRVVERALPSPRAKLAQRLLGLGS